MTRAPGWSPYRPDALPPLSAAQPGRGRVIALAATDQSRERGWAAEIALGLARSWAGVGAEVVLVDAHLDAPLLHRTLGVTNDVGIADVLLYGSSLAGVSRSAEDGRFRLVCAGSPVADPVDVFSHPRWSELMGEVRDDGVTALVFVPETGPATRHALEPATDIVVIASAGESANDLSAADPRVRAVFGLAGDESAAEDEVDLVDPLYVDPLTVDRRVPEATGASAPGQAASDEDTPAPDAYAEDEHADHGVRSGGDGERAPSHEEDEARSDRASGLEARVPTTLMNTPIAWEGEEGEAPPLEQAPSSSDTGPIDPVAADPPNLSMDPPARGDDGEAAVAGGVDAAVTVGDESVGAPPLDLPPVAEAVTSEASGPELASDDASRDGPDADDAVLADHAPAGATDEDTAATGADGAEPEDEDYALADELLASARPRPRARWVALLGAGAVVAAGYVLWPTVGSLLEGSAETVTSDTSSPDDTPRETDPAGEPPEASQAAPTAAEARPDALRPRFAITFAAYVDVAAAEARRNALAASLPDQLVTLAPVQVGDRVFHRVLGGLALDEPAADVLADELAARLGQDRSPWVLREVPLAFEIGRDADAEAAASRAAVLIEDGVPAYVLAVPLTDGTVEHRVYAGAYLDATEAAHLGSELRARGIEAPLAERRGGRPG